MTEEEIVQTETVIEEPVTEAVEEAVAPSIEERLASLEGQLRSIVEIG